MRQIQVGCQPHKKHLLKAMILFCAIMQLCQVFNTTPNRRLSIYDPNDAPVCKWEPPDYDIPAEIDWYKTLVVGFPSGDKRMTFMQMEALTGWAAKDEWAFTYDGITNHPFIKSNFPHHDGVWSWQDAGDQILLVVRNMRSSMVEFHDIMWDLDYTKSFEEALNKEELLYEKQPSLEDFRLWRDVRLMREIHWFGWFIDYWMEAGLMRDLMSHRVTTSDHWIKFMTPGDYTAYELSYEAHHAENDEITPTYDPHCINKVSGGCTPINVISGERLLDPSTGPSETQKIGDALKGKPGISEYLINEEAWPCLWNEMIVNKKGEKTFLDREGYEERNYNFSEEMLQEMIEEYDRLIEKYSSAEWSSKPIANTLIDLFLDHRSWILQELSEVKSGVRTLTDNDFLGPMERQKRKIRHLSRHGHAVADNVELFEDHSAFFSQMEANLREKRRKLEKETFLKQEETVRKMRKSKQ